MESRLRKRSRRRTDARVWPLPSLCLPGTHPARCLRCFRNVRSCSGKDPRGGGWSRPREPRVWTFSLPLRLLPGRCWRQAKLLVSTVVSCKLDSSSDCRIVFYNVAAAFPPPDAVLFPEGLFLSNRIASRIVTEKRFGDTRPLLFGAESLLCSSSSGARPSLELAPFVRVVRFHSDWGVRVAVGERGVVACGGPGGGGVMCVCPRQGSELRSPLSEMTGARVQIFRRCRARV